MNTYEKKEGVATDPRQIPLHFNQPPPPLLPPTARGRKETYQPLMHLTGEITNALHLEGDDRKESQ